MKRFRHARVLGSSAIGLGIIVMLCGQAPVYDGARLDANPQRYTMRSEFGHSLDRNTRLGDLGYNTPRALTRDPYTVNRVLQQRDRLGYPAPSSANVNYYRQSAALTGNRYRVSGPSNAYRQSLLHSRAGPYANPGQAYGAYRVAPVRPVGGPLAPRLP